MAEKFVFDLVSPERLLMSRDVEMVVVPGGGGHFGVLKGHAAMLSTVEPGVVDVYTNRADAPERIFVAGGFAEVTGDRLTVLAEEATPVDQISASEAEAKVRDLAEDLADAKSDHERAVTAKALKVARARVKALAG